MIETRKASHFDCLQLVMSVKSGGGIHDYDIISLSAWLADAQIAMCTVCLAIILPRTCFWTIYRTLLAVKALMLYPLAAKCRPTYASSWDCQDTYRSRALPRHGRSNRALPNLPQYRTVKIVRHVFQLVGKVSPEVAPPPVATLHVLALAMDRLNVSKVKRCWLLTDCITGAGDGKAGANACGPAARFITIWDARCGSTISPPCTMAARGAPAGPGTSPPSAKPSAFLMSHLPCCPPPQMPLICRSSTSPAPRPPVS